MMVQTNKGQTIVYKTAIYCRLSKDDGFDDMSQSIQNQKESLSNYVKDQGWKIIDVYIDDGYSGTNFNRPAFKRLIKDIENKKIDCVVSKDLSRLGRNYLQTGYYTEEFFPMNNVRYIALNDSYDSLDDEHDFMPFKNIINEWYAKDISKKIKSVFKYRQKEGSLIINSPYGYINDKEKGRIIDRKTAPVIEYIFHSFAVDGKSIRQICSELTNKKILTPKSYKSYLQSDNNEVLQGYSLQDTYKWSPNMIYKILEDYQYTGALVCNKAHRTSFKNNKVIRNDKSEWITHEKKFEPIITLDLYNKAKAKLQNAAKAKLPLTINKYNGILYCAECGRKATFLRDISFPNGIYICRIKSCHRKRIKIEEMDEIIKKELLNFKEIILRNEDKILEFIKNNQINKEKFSNDEVINELDMECIKYKNNISKALEAKCSGEIAQTIYEMIVNESSSKISDITSRINMIRSNMKNDTNDAYSAMTFIQNIKAIDENITINRRIISLLIKRINYFYKNNTLNFTIEYSGIDWLVKRFGEVIKK